MKPIFVILQPWLPQHLISRFVGWVARSRWRPLKQLLINRVSAWYQIELDDYEIGDAEQYQSFNDFFTRAVKAETRPIADQANHVACPVDGTVSQLGSITQDQIFQAKGKHFSTAAILGDALDAEAFDDGQFATLYLAPNNYHRIHMPLNGTLTALRYIPGRLFSVNTASATHIDQVFARNERVVALFDTSFGKMAMILVGALNVGSIETLQHGVVAPNASKQIINWKYHDSDQQNYIKGREFGRFNLGSTVVLLFGKDAINWHQHLEEGATIKMGMPIASSKP